MKYLTLIVLLSIRAINASGQPPDSLIELQGYPKTYYSNGSKDYANHIQNLLNDAINYFEAEFGTELRVELYILNPDDAEKFGMRYPLPRSSDEPAIIYMPEKGFLEFKLENNKRFIGKNKFYASDFIVIHELGHIIKHKTEVKNHKWFGEFIAAYFQIGYMKERLPNLTYPTWTKNVFTFLPLKNKTLEDFEPSYGGGPINYVAYQLRFGELASYIFEERGWKFVNESLDLYDSLAKSGHDSKSAFPIVIEYISSINQESASWFDSLIHTFHPYIIIVFLLINSVASLIFSQRIMSYNRTLRTLLIANFTVSILVLISASTIYFL